MSFQDEYSAWKKKKQEKNGYSSFREGYIEHQIKRGRINLEGEVSRLNTDIQSWWQAHDKYIQGYNDRFSKENSGYRSDSKDYLDSVLSQNQSLLSQQESIRQRLSDYGKYLDAKWVENITKMLDDNKGSYKTILDGATKDNQYWSQWATEDDYNNAVWENDFYKLIQDGKYDEAEAMAASKAQEFAKAHPDIDMTDPDAYSPEFITAWQKLSEYEKDLKNAREYSLYKPLIDKYEGMSHDELKGAMEELKLEYHNAVSNKPSGADPAGLNRAGVEDIQREMEYVSSLINETSRWHKVFGIYDDLTNKIDDIGKNVGIPIDSKQIISSVSDIATGVKKLTELPEYFQDSELFEDGYQVGDVLGTTVSSAADVGVNLLKGATGAVEGLVDLGAYGVAYASDALGEEEFADAVKRAAIQSQTEQLWGWASDAVNPYSVLSDQTDGLVQSLAQMYTIGLGAGAAGLGTIGTTILNSAGMGLSAMGSSMGEAYLGGATDGEAAAYGAMSGVIEAGSELIFGGLGKAVNAIGFSKGISSLDDAFAKKLSDKISSQFWKNAVQFGVKAGAEGVEELIAGFGSAVAKKLTYMSEEDLGKLILDERLLEAFVSGVVMSGLAQSGYIPGTTKGSLREANKTGRDFITGLTADGQAYVDSEYQSRIAEAEQAGKKLSRREKWKTYEDVLKSITIDEGVQKQFAKRDANTKQQFTADVEKKLSTQIADKQLRSQMADTLTKIAYGEHVSNAELRKVANSKKALKVLSELTGTKYKAGEVTVRDLRQAITPLQKTSARLSSANVLATYAAHFNMDEIAERSLMVSYATDVKNTEGGKVANPEDYAVAYNKVYAAGKKGTDISEIAADAGKILSQSAIAQAYRAGQNAGAAQISQKGLSNGLDSGTINTVNKEAQNGQGLYLRDGGEWNDGTNPGGQVSAVEGNARQNKGRGEGRTGSRDSEASSLSYDREVSAKELVKGGLESSKVWLPTEGSETASMKEARKIAESRGLKVVFFGGGNLKVLKGSKIISARAYIQGDTVYVRVDHAGFAADQLMKHEAAHDMIDKGEINVADVKKLISERFTPEEIDAVINSYAIAYKKAGMTADEIWEEVICDSVAEMNSFEGTDFTAAAEMAADFLPDLKEAVLESKKESRGPPAGNVEGKASRETRRAKYIVVNNSIRGEIENQLRTLYGNVKNGIATEIAVPIGTDIYVIDSGKENGKISFGIRKIITISNESLRNEYIRRQNNDAVSNGYVSDGLSSRFRSENDSHRRGNKRQEFGEKLSVDQGKSADKQSGISDKNADNRGVNGKASHDFEYTEKQYEAFGWARRGNIVSYNNLEDLYSKIQGRKSLRSFPQSAKGEAIIAVNNHPGSNLEFDNTLLFVTGTKNSPRITRVIKIDLYDETDIEIVERNVYESEKQYWSRARDIVANLFEAELIREYRPKDFPSYQEYKAESGQRILGREGERNNRNNQQQSERRGDPNQTFNDGIEGKASQELFENEDLDKIDAESEIVERELSNREILANMLESVAESTRDKKILSNYKDHLAKIAENKSEIARLREESREADKAGKKAITRQIEKLKAEIDYSEKRLRTLEDSATLKYLVSKERKAKLAEAHLAGQMAQGRRDAEILRHANERLDKQKGAYTEKLAEQQRLAREALDKQAKRYQESRKKSVEGRHKTEMRHKIQRVVSELDKLLRKGNKERNIKLGLQDAVAAALEAFDINAEKVARYERDMANLDQKIAEATDPIEIEALQALRDKKQRNSELLADKLLVMKKAYEDIHNNAGDVNYPAHYRAEAKVIGDRISSVLEKVGNVSISEMSLSQLESVYDMYRMVLTTVRDANKAFINGKLEDLSENAADMTAELQKIKKLPEERLRAGDDARAFVWNELTPYYAFKRIGSKTLMRYYDELVRGQDVYAKDLDEAKRFAEDLRKKYKSKAWNRNKIVTFKDRDGRELRLNLGHMMSIYAYSKREQAFDHMEKGGFFFNNKETFRKKGGVLEFIASNESGYKVDATVFAQIKAALTPEQIAYVDEMQAYLTKMGEKGNEVTRQMWGIDIFKEKVYFPLKSKEDFIYQANTPAETSSLKNDGMTKETKPHASNPIVLESFDEVWANHVNKMSMYHGFVIPIDNLNKLINYGSWMDGESQAISTMLEARFSHAVNDYLNTFIKDLNGAKNQNGGLLGVMSNWLTKFKKTAVAASLSVVVQQPTAILRAISEIDARYFMHLPSAEKLSAKWERIQKYAPIAIIKDIGGFDAGSGRQITEWLNADTRQGVTKAMNKLDDFTMYGAALGDRVGWGSIWTAVEREVQVKQNLKYGTEEFWQACGKRFTEIIVKTQVYDSTLSRSGFMRGKDGLLKMATAFMGEPTLSVNMLADAILQGKRGTMKKRQVVRTVAAVYTATIAASLIKSLIYALRDDDEDESYAEKYLQAFGGTILNDVNPLSMLPVFRDVVSILDGWEVERTDMAIVQDLYNAITALDSENKTTWRKFEDLAGALGALAGVPAKNLLRTAREMYNAINDIFGGIDGGDLGGAFVEGVTGKEKTKAQTLYDAIVGKDKERIDVLKSEYDDEEEYMAAVRVALRECDPRIKKASQAYLEGDLITRNEIMLEILGEGAFDKETVDRAIDAERDELDRQEGKDEGSEDKNEWNLVYSPSDIPLAFDNCSDELALEIIAELSEIKIEEKVAEAKARAEAKGEKFDEDEAREDAENSVRSTLRSSLTKHYKPLYQAAYASGDQEEMKRIKNVLKTSGLYVFKTKKTIDDVLEEWIEE